MYPNPAFRRRIAVAITVLSIAGAPARADLGVPMLAVVWPVSWLLLPVIIALEAWVAVRVLSVRYGEGVRLATTASLFSTLLGIPVAWLVHLAGGLWIGYGLIGVFHGAREGAAVQVLTSPWIFPDDPVKGWQTWMVIEAAMVLCVPFYLMSVLIEGWAVKKGTALDMTARVWRWAWWANLLSYGLIEAGLAVMLVLALKH